MVEAGCHYAVMEVSSQGIKQHRIDGIWFEIAVFTNFGEDTSDQASMQVLGNTDITNHVFLNSAGLE